MRSFPKKGFTLIELLVVIGILAILATVVVVLINPSEYTNRARDSQRVTDLSTVKKAVELAATFTSLKGQVLDYDGPNYTQSCVGQSAQKIFVSVPSTETAPPAPVGWTYIQQDPADLYLVNGDGWLPIDFPTVFNPQSPPLSKLPIDPVNSFVSGYYYSYVCGSFQLFAKMESQKFQDKAMEDGGNLLAYFETGTNGPEFANVPAPYSPEICWDKKDNDGDGKIDEDDPDCEDATSTPPAPPLASLTPSTAPNNGPVTITNVTITSFNLTGPISVKLYKSGAPDIVGTGFSVINPTTLGTGTFNIKNAPTGQWSLAVTNGGSETVTCNNCFTITAGTQQTAYVKIDDLFATNPVITGTVLAPVSPTAEGVNPWYADDAPPPTAAYIFRASDSSLTTDPTIVFKGYQFAGANQIPAGATINGICVLINDSTISTVPPMTGMQKWKIALSKNGGSTFSQENDSNSDINTGGLAVAGNDQYFTDSGTVAALGTDPGTNCGTWNQTWVPSDFASTNFAVKLTAVNDQSIATNIRADVIKVKVIFTIP